MREGAERVVQLKENNDQLSRLADDTQSPPSQSMLRAIQRHREVYQDYARELRRTKVRERVRSVVSDSGCAGVCVEECMGFSRGCSAFFLTSIA